MRQFILFISILTSVCCYAQKSAWKATKFPGDELLGNPAYTAYSMEKNGSRIVFWSNDDAFRITEAYHIFEYTHKDYSDKDEFDVIIGFYNLKDELVNSMKKTFYVEDGHGYPKYPSLCDVVRYITEEQGYVRLVAELYNTVATYDIKVPCFNNPVKRTTNNTVRRKTSTPTKTRKK